MTEFHSIGKFGYRAPESLPAALKILGVEKHACKVLAGGTDLILQMKQGSACPSLVIDVKQVPELNNLEWSEKEGLHIGAAENWSRWKSVEDSGVRPISLCLRFVLCWP